MLPIMSNKISIDRIPQLLLVFQTHKGKNKES